MADPVGPDHQSRHHHRAGCQHYQSLFHIGLFVATALVAAFQIPMRNKGTKGISFLFTIGDLRFTRVGRRGNGQIRALLLAECHKAFLPHQWVKQHGRDGFHSVPFLSARGGWEMSGTLWKASLPRVWKGGHRSDGLTSLLLGVLGGNQPGPWPLSCLKWS